MATGLIAVEVLIFIGALIGVYGMLTLRPSGAWGPSGLGLSLILVVFSQFQFGDVLGTTFPAIYFHRIGLVADVIIFAVGGTLGWLWERYNSSHELGFFWRVLWWIDLMRLNISAMNLGHFWNFEHDPKWWGHKYREKL